MTGGQRVAQEIRRRVNYGKVKPELDRLGITQGVFYHWEHGRFDPQFYYMQQLEKAGYDTHYILTGERKMPEPDIDFDIAEHEEEE